MHLRQGRELTDADILQVARLHAACLNQGFLSKLGEDLLVLLYRDMTMQEDVFVIAAEVNGEIAGFVAGACHVGGLYRHFVLRHAFDAGLRILPSFLSLKTLRRVTETLLYPLTRRRHTEIPLPEAELLSIAVGENHRGTPVAAVLYHALMEQFQARGEKAFQIRVGAELQRAIRFYEKMGARQATHIEVHRGEPSVAMVHDLPPIPVNPVKRNKENLTQRRNARSGRSSETVEPSAMLYRLGSRGSE